MSHIALARGLKVLHHLVQHGSARFKDLAKLLDPISPASQMRLLQTLTGLGEVEKEDNQYRLAPSSVFRVAASSDPFAFAPEVDAELGELVKDIARQTSYSAALFGWVTPGSMIILNSYSPLGTDVRYRPAGQEWPLIPFHDYAQLFLAYAPEFFREDAFFRWNLYLNDEYRVKDFQGYIERLNAIRANGYTLSEEVPRSFGSLVRPVFVHDEALPRFALGILIYNAPPAEKIEELLGALAQAQDRIRGILAERVAPKQLELEIDRLRKVVQYVDPHHLH